MNKDKLILPVTILLSSVILGSFYYASEKNKQSSLERQWQIESEYKKQEIEKDIVVEEVGVDENGGLEENKEEVLVETGSNIEVQSSGGNIVQSQKNNELILINYRLDSEDLDDLSSTLTEIVYNNPHTVCASIIENRTIRDNIYYIFLDELNNLEAEYGEYKYDIQYIGNNLYSYYNLNQIIKDKCASVGYDI